MRRTLILHLALAALLGVACDAELSPGATVAQAAHETRAEGSARVSYAAVFDVAAPGAVPLKGEGIFDYAHQRGRMVFDMAVPLQRSGAEPATTEDVEMIVDGLVLYLQMPSLAEMLPDSRPWIKIDLEAAASATRIDLSQFTQLGQGDPTQVLELLRGVTRGVEEVGEARVRGALTTHFETRLDLARVAEGAPEEAMASLQNLIGRSDSTEIVADVWVDEDGRLRKMTYEVDLSAPEDAAGSQATAPGSMAVTMELYDFGVAVDVTPPPEDRVVDLVRLSEQG